MHFEASKGLHALCRDSQHPPWSRQVVYPSPPSSISSLTEGCLAATQSFEGMSVWQEPLLCSLLLPPAMLLLFSALTESSAQL